MNIEIILRSKSFAKKIGRFEGFYPFKHVGIRVYDDEKSEVHHVQKSHFWPLSPIRITKCSEEEFSAGMGVKSLISKTASRQSVESSIELMNRYDGKAYIPILRDCDYVASICFNGKRMVLLHRQLWVYISLILLIHATVHSYYLAKYHWDQNYLILNWSAVIFAFIASIVIFSIFFLKINNTSAQPNNQADGK